jgi:hypothetical protein
MAKTLSLLASTLVLFSGIAISAAPGWQIESVDGPGPGKYASLKFDTAGNAHLAYVIDDGSRYPLRYGYWDHLLNRWFVMTVDQGASFCSLVLDSKQQPHISYADAGTGSGAKLRYAHWDQQSRTWKKQAIPLNSDVIAYYTSIALDSNDYPSISFYEYRGPKGTDISVRMRVVVWNGNNWQVQTVDGQNQSGKFNALAIDAQNHKHLVYANVNALTTGMRYAYWTGTTWNLEIFDGPAQNDGGYVGYAASLALDKAGNPHVTYMNYSSPTLKYAVRKDGRWEVESVERLAGVGYPDRSGIFVSDAGEPYISYYNAGQGSLKLAHREGRQWVTETVDNNGCGFTSSIQIDRGTIWIAYADEGGSGGLKIAHRKLDVREATRAAMPESHEPVMPALGGAK